MEQPQECPQQLDSPGKLSSQTRTAGLHIALGQLPAFQSLGTACSPAAAKLGAAESQAVEQKPGHADCQALAPQVGTAAEPEQAQRRPLRSRSRGRSFSGAVGSRMAVEMDTLRSVFHLSREEAADALGMSVSSLKRCCHALGIQRWPHRKLRSLQGLLKHHLAEPLPDPGEQQALISAVQREHEAIMLNPDHELDDMVLLRRVNKYKTVYARKMAHLDKSLTELSSRMRARRNSTGNGRRASDASLSDGGMLDALRELQPAVAIKPDPDAAPAVAPAPCAATAPGAQSRHATPRRSSRVNSPTHQQSSQANSPIIVTVTEPAPVKLPGAAAGAAGGASKVAVDPVKVEPLDRANAVRAVGQLGPMLALPRLPRTKHVAKKQASADLYGVHAIPRPAGRQQHQAPGHTRAHPRSGPLPASKALVRPLSGSQQPVIIKEEPVARGSRKQAPGRTRRVAGDGYGDSDSSWEEDARPVGSRDQLVMPWDSAGFVVQLPSKSRSDKACVRVQRVARAGPGSSRPAPAIPEPLLRSRSMTDVQQQVPCSRFCITNLLPSSSDMRSLNAHDAAVYDRAGTHRNRGTTTSVPDAGAVLVALPAFDGLRSPSQLVGPCSPARICNYLDGDLGRATTWAAQVPKSTHKPAGGSPSSSPGCLATPCSPPLLQPFTFLDDQPWDPAGARLEQLDDCSGWLSGALGRRTARRHTACLDQSSSTPPHPEGLCLSGCQQPIQIKQELLEMAVTKAVRGPQVHVQAGSSSGGGGNAGGMAAAAAVMTVGAPSTRTTQDGSLAVCTVHPSLPADKQQAAADRDGKEEGKKEQAAPTWPPSGPGKGMPALLLGPAPPLTAAAAAAGLTAYDESASVRTRHQLPEWNVIRTDALSGAPAALTPANSASCVLPVGLPSWSHQQQAQVEVQLNSLSSMLPSSCLPATQQHTSSLVAAVPGGWGVAVERDGEWQYVSGPVTGAAGGQAAGSRPTARNPGSPVLRTQALDAERLPKLSFFATGSSMDVMLDDLAWTCKTQQMAPAAHDTALPGATGVPAASHGGGDKMLISSLEGLVASGGAGGLWGASPGASGAGAPLELAWPQDDHHLFMLSTDVGDVDLGLDLGL